MTNAVTYSVSEGIADIVLTRPPVNALDLATVREIIAALRRAAADAQVGAVVMSSGTPRRFCAGLDLDQVQGKSVSEMHTLLSALYVELHDVQLALGKPSIAAVAGAARGAGMTLSISCDVIIAGEKATFGRFAVEIGFDQKQAVEALFRDAGATDVRTLRDLADRDRVVAGAKKTLERVG